MMPWPDSEPCDSGAVPRSQRISKSTARAFSPGECLEKVTDPLDGIFVCALGIRQRGCQELFFLVFLKQRDDLPLGITMAEGEKAPAPPESKECYIEAAKLAFRDGDALIQHSDSAGAFVDVSVPGVVQKFHVNHSEKEYARSVSILKNIDTGETRAGITGSMTVDRSWRTVKEGFPKGGQGISAKTAAGRKNLMRKIRSRQWFHILSTSDRWDAFCQAAKRFADDDSPEKKAELLGPVPPEPEVVREVADDVAEEHSSYYLEFTQTWGDRYFEHQQAGRCGQHAVNNLLAMPQYTVQDMESSLDAVVAELGVDSKSDHGNAAGWYSHSVLADIFQKTSPAAWKLGMTRVAADKKHWCVLQGLHVCGILINIGPGVHWTCIVTHVGHTFYVDSQQFPPSLIDEENFRSILAQHPDAYFVMMHEMDEDILLSPLM